MEEITVPENPKVRHIRLNNSDPHKLKKYKVLRFSNYLISVDDIPVKQVKMYGKIKR